MHRSLCFCLFVFPDIWHFFSIIWCVLSYSIFNYFRFLSFCLLKRIVTVFCAFICRCHFLNYSIVEFSCSCSWIMALFVYPKSSNVLLLLVYKRVSSAKSARLTFWLNGIPLVYISVCRILLMKGRSPVVLSSPSYQLILFYRKLNYKNKHTIYNITLSIYLS